MQYFILFPGDTEADTILDTNILGEVSFGTFYTSAGWKAFTKVIQTRPELISSITIKNSRGESITIDEFLNLLKYLKIVTDSN